MPRALRAPDVEYFATECATAGEAAPLDHIELDPALIRLLSQSRYVELANGLVALELTLHGPGPEPQIVQIPMHRIDSAAMSQALWRLSTALIEGS